MQYRKLLILYAIFDPSPSQQKRFFFALLLFCNNTYNIKVFYTIYAKVKEKGVQKNYL